jgi:hypothetical protein
MGGYCAGCCPCSLGACRYGTTALGTTWMRLSWKPLFVDRGSASYLIADIEAVGWINL